MRLRSRKSANRRGSALIVVAAMIVVALAIASYAINVVYMEMTRTELQITTDLATRAACRVLIDSGSKAEAVRSAQRLADANLVAGQSLEIAYSDIAFSVATRSSDAEGYRFSTGDSPNAVHFRAAFFERSVDGLPMLFPTLGLPVTCRPIKSASATQSDLDIAIVFDCSSSMLAGLSEPAPPEGLLELPILTPVPLNARWRVARDGVIAMLNEFEASRQEELVSITAFNTAVLFNLGMSKYYGPIREFLAFQEFAYLGGMSDLSGGMNKGLDHLSDERRSRPWASRIVLLISDGNGNLGTNSISVAQSAAAGDVTLYTISIGNDANRSLMKRLAEVSHGQYFHANSASEFRDIAKSITRRLPILLTR